MWETWVRSLGPEDLLEKEMATHCSILAWRIPWVEEPGGLQSTGSQRVRHYWATSLSLSLYWNYTWMCFLHSKRMDNSQSSFMSSYTLKYFLVSGTWHCISPCLPFLGAPFCSHKNEWLCFLPKICIGGDTSLDDSGIGLFTHLSGWIYPVLEFWILFIQWLLQFYMFSCTSLLRSRYEYPITWYDYLNILNICF